MVYRNSSPARLPWTNNNSMRGYAHARCTQGLFHKQQQQHLLPRAPFSAWQPGPAHKAQMPISSHVRQWGLAKDLYGGRTFCSMQPMRPSRRPTHKLPFIARAAPTGPYTVQPTRFKRHRSRSSRRFRKQQQHRRRAVKVQQEAAAPQSPVCPPAPFNSNSYLMEYHATAWQPPVNPFDAPAAAGSIHNNCCPACPTASPQQTSDESLYDLYKPQQQQAAPAAPSAVLEAEVAEWDPLLQEVTTLQRSCAARASPTPSTSATTDDAPVSPVCPPAPLLTNEFYASRWEQQQVQQEAPGNAAAAAHPVLLLLQAEVVEWDPLLKEVTTLQRSTAHSQPATCIPAYDSCSQC